MQTKALLEITRPLNCAMAAFGVFVGYCIAIGLIAIGLQLLTAMAVAFLVCAGGMVINDVFDAGIDARLNPKKPIPSGKISAKRALHYSALLFVAGNLIAFYFLPIESFAIAIAFTFLLSAYARFLPKFKYFGNWVVAAGTAFTLIFGASLVGNYSIVSFFAFSALLANVAREIIKDIQDMKQEKGYKLSLPMVAGIFNAANAAVILTAIAVIISYIPKVFGFGNIVFLVVLTLSNLCFVFSVMLVKEQDFAKAQRGFKAAMLIALCSFLIGVVA